MAEVDLIYTEMNRAELQKTVQAASAFCFDLDGTLLNTIDDLAYATNYALQARGYPTRDLTEVRSFVGNGIRKLLERSLPAGVNLPPAEFDLLAAEFYQYYGEHLWDHSEVYEGILPVLAALKAQDKKLFVVTNKTESLAIRLVEHFFPDTFLEVSGDTEAKALKPDPAVILDILAKYNLEPAQTVMVGDSDTDVEVSLRAGVFSLAAAWGYKDADFLLKHGAKVILREPQAMLEILSA